MKTNKLFIPLIVTLLLLPLGSGAESIAITLPTDNDDLTIGSIFNLTGTISTTEGDETLNCSLYDKLRNEIYDTTPITIIADPDDPNANSSMFYRNETNDFHGLFEVPNEFGKHFMIVRCDNSTANTFNTSEISVSYKRYSPVEISESIFDNIVGIIAALFSFVAIIGLVILFVWIRKGIKR